MTMSDGYYWCIRHGRVEHGDEVCPVRHRIGPFRTPGEASHALHRVRERNEAWDEEDARWEGEEE